MSGVARCRVTILFNAPSTPPSVAVADFSDLFAALGDHVEVVPPGAIADLAIQSHLQGR